MQKENCWRIFYDNVKYRTDKLIEYGIWSGIDANQFKAWLNNFHTEREKFFSALILDSLVYRTKDHTLSMLYDLFTRDLHNIWRLKKESLFNKDVNPLSLLKNKYNEIGFRIVTTAKSADPNTKSGFHMIYLLNHEMNVHSKWTIKISDMKNLYREGIRCFVLLDDISCTGEQIVSVLDEINIDNYPNATFYIALCTIHQMAIDTLKEKYPTVNVIYTEYLNYQNNFFNSIPINETDYKNKQEAIDKYNTFLKNKKIKYYPSLGKGELALTYAFNHNVPNNCLPILHYQNEIFKKLINKRP